MCHINVEWRDMQSSEFTLGSQEQLKTCKWRKSLLCGTQELSKDTSEDQWQAQHISIQGREGTPEFLPWALKNFKATDFGSRSRNANKHQSWDPDGQNFLQGLTISSYCLRKKISLLEDFVSIMTNCCFHSSFSYFRETFILYVVTPNINSPSEFIFKWSLSFSGM